MKILLFPGAFQFVANYRNYDGVDIWLKSTSLKKFPSADYYIGHSAGSAFILRNCILPANSKFILVNPLIRKRGVFSAGLSWIKYFLSEGIDQKKIVPAANWFHGLRLVKQLLDVDFSVVIGKIPKENIVIIRGKNDHWICDEESAKILKDKEIHCIEVDAGHDWSENIAVAVENLLKT
jgi:hypothetical protein